MDVTGCIVGHDGSGGRHSRHIRTRRCGFETAVIRMLSDGSLVTVGFDDTSVPRKHIAPRSEMVGLLHALLQAFTLVFQAPFNDFQFAFQVGEISFGGI